MADTQKGNTESAFDKTKEAFYNAAEATKEYAHNAKVAVFGEPPEPSAEEKAAQKVKDAADYTAEKITDAREGFL